MRYFTRKLVEGELTDEETSRAFEEYAQYVSSSLPSLPVEVKELVAENNLHDALILVVERIELEATLSISYLAGENRRYKVVAIKYFGVSMTERDFSALVEAARDRRTEVLYDELRLLEDGRFEHSLLLSPAGEFSLAFDRVELESHSAAGRWFEFVGDPVRAM
jgi:Protein of unknown function (DUF4085)